MGRKPLGVFMFRIFWLAAFALLFLVGAGPPADPPAAFGARPSYSSEERIWVAVTRVASEMAGPV